MGLLREMGLNADGSRRDGGDEAKADGDDDEDGAGAGDDDGDDDGDDVRGGLLVTRMGGGTPAPPSGVVLPVCACV